MGGGPLVFGQCKRDGLHHPGNYPKYLGVFIDGCQVDAKYGSDGVVMVALTLPTTRCPHQLGSILRLGFWKGKEDTFRLCTSSNISAFRTHSITRRYPDPMGPPKKKRRSRALIWGKQNFPREANGPAGPCRGAKWRGERAPWGSCETALVGAAAPAGQGQTGLAWGKGPAGPRAAVGLPPIFGASRF